MIEIERHIEILLLDNDCVIVPGLGGFMTHHVEARYDERDNMFLPPMRTLGFNPQLKMNDSLLAQSYIEAYDMSYPEAIKRIENETMEIRQNLENTGVYELNDIGTLLLNDNGNIEFNPCESGILTPELYGLAGFEIDKLVDNSISAKDLVLQNIDNVFIEGSSKKEEALIYKVGDKEKEVSKEEVVYYEDDKDIRIPIGVVRYALAAAAAILLFFILTSPIANSETKGITQSSIRNGILFNLLGEHTSKPVDEKPLIIKSSKPESSIKDKSNSAKDSTKSYQYKGKESVDSKHCKEYYCLVLASKVTKSNADSFVKDMHKKGYDNTKVYCHNNNIKVIYGCYESESQAYNVLNELHSKADEFKESWVYKIKE